MGIEFQVPSAFQPLFWVVFVAFLAWFLYRKFVVAPRARRDRIRAAAGLAGRSSIDSFGMDAARRLLGDRVGVDLLYMLCCKQKWGAVYLVDQVVIRRDSDGDKHREMELLCVVTFRGVELPDFELVQKGLFDRLGVLGIRVTGPSPIRLEAGSGLPDDWLLLGRDDASVRALFAGGLAHVLVQIDTPGFTATKNKIFFARGGSDSLSSRDLDRFLQDGIRVGGALAPAIASRKSS